MLAVHVRYLFSISSTIQQNVGDKVFGRFIFESLSELIHFCGLTYNS